MAINLTWKDQPLIMTAKVDAALNASDFMRWDYQFTGNLTNDEYSGTSTLHWNGSSPANTDGDKYLSGGVWQFIATSSLTAGTPIDIIARDTSELLGQITELNTPVEITLPPDTYQYLQFRQNGGLSTAVVQMHRTKEWDTSGNTPIVTTSGNQITVSWDYTPRAGIFTATVKAYDANNAFIVESNPVTLTIQGASNGGGC